jgi:hypothetical protein
LALSNNGVEVLQKETSIPIWDNLRGLAFLRHSAIALGLLSNKDQREQQDQELQSKLHWVCVVKT